MPRIVTLHDSSEEAEEDGNRTIRRNDLTQTSLCADAGSSNAIYDAPAEENARIEMFFATLAESGLTAEQQTLIVESLERCGLQLVVAGPPGD